MNGAPHSTRKYLREILEAIGMSMTHAATGPPFLGSCSFWVSLIPLSSQEAWGLFEPLPSRVVRILMLQCSGAVYYAYLTWVRSRLFMLGREILAGEMSDHVTWLTATLQFQLLLVKIWECPTRPNSPTKSPLLHCCTAFVISIIRKIKTSSWTFCIVS